MKRVFLLAVVVLLISGPGCSRTVLDNDSDLNVRQKLVVTFADGSWIRGKIGLDEKVTIVSDGSIYRARIDDLNDSEIFVGNCTFIRKVGDRNAAYDRLTNARIDLNTDPVSFVFYHTDIVTVERVEVDPIRTGANSLFWMITGAVGLILLGEKS